VAEGATEEDSGRQRYPGDLDALQRHPGKRGHEVHLYSFAFDDLSVVKEVRPDLVVLDLIIGNEDHGWQLLQKMKMDRETATIPVIVCSAAIRLLRELEGR
jgi:CheY-like chemotaxis protein